MRCRKCVHYGLCEYSTITDKEIQCRDFISKEDFVEVVRCKDCVHYCGFEHCENGICDRYSVSKRAVFSDDFCSYGETRGD